MLTRTGTVDVGQALAESPYGGAYGLALPQLPKTPALLPAPAAWKPWLITWSDDPLTGPWVWSGSRAELPLQPGGRAVIDREHSRTTLHGVAPSDEGLLHPYLGSTALAVAAWEGRLALHAGVVERHGQSWGLLGERGAGKSSTLLWWSMHAGRIMADDLLITDGRSVLAGPRFVDLRASAANHYGVGVDVGVLGSRRRWRVPMEPVPAETPLAGLVELEWGSELHIDLVPVEERLTLLARHHGVRFPVDDLLSTMRTLAVPTIRFVRPREWDSIDDTLHRLVEVMDNYAL